MSDRDALDAQIEESAPQPDYARCVDAEPFDVGRIDALRADTVDAAERDAVNQHLNACGHCRTLAIELGRWTPEMADRLAPAVSAKPWLPIGALVAAAAILLVVLWPRVGEGPSYTAEPLTGGVVEVRAEQGGDTFLPHSTLRWQLTPAERQDGVTAAVILTGPTGQRAGPAPQVADGGAVVLEAKADALFGKEFGPWKIRIDVTAGGATARHEIQVRYVREVKR